MRRELEEKINNAPTNPGCYFWKDKNNKIIYVGKAKDIRKRIKQYFRIPQNKRITKLVESIYDVDYIIVNNENDALVLENNLIKTNKPKFNILLKENTNYPYIILTNETHPRIIYTRKYNSFSGKAYGPFPAVKINAYELYNMLQRIIPFRKCSRLPDKKCVYYDMGECLGPCINKISLSEYEKWKKEVNNIFQGKTKDILVDLRNKELKSSELLDFESAKYYYELQHSLKKISEKQVVEFIKNIDIDIIGFFNNDEYLSINIFNFISGKLISKNEFISKYYDEDYEDAVVSYLLQYYSQNKIPKEIYINISDNQLILLQNILETKVNHATKSKYKKLILLAIQNAKKYLNDYKLKSDYEYNKTIGSIEELSKLLSIDYCTRIDMVDNSNLFNENAISAFVTFVNGIKEKKLFRKLILKNNNSDYHYMIEAITRRYKDKNDLPDLLIVDGGKLQVNAAIEATKMININLQIIGLKKDYHHKTYSIIKSDGTEINLDKNSSLYNFLSNIQEEVHRFAITFFREKRIKSQISDFLDSINGLGPKTRDKLLTIYPNLYELKNINIKTLEQIVGKKMAKIVKEKIDNELK